MKAISAVIATIMLLMISVSLISVFYVFSSTMATTTTASGSEQASQLTAQLSYCMQVDNIVGNQITLRNCGKGVIENKSLVVMLDDIVLGANTATIQEGNSSVVNVSGLWQVPFGKRNLKISNGAAVALALVEIIPNPDGFAGSWNFDEGSGSNAYDASGNGNAGTLTNMNITGNATSGWADGRFGGGLQFDGVNDYVNAGNGTSLNITNKITVSTWMRFDNTTSSPTPITKERWVSPTDNGGFMFRISANKLSFNILNNAFYSATDTDMLTTGTWYHTVGNFDGFNIKLYMNGELKKTAGFSGIIGSHSAINLIISQNAPNYRFNGTIDEVRIWKKAFSPDDTIVMKQII